MLFLHWLFSWQTSILVRLCYFYTGFQLADKHTCETMPFSHWCFSWQTSIHVRLCYFYTGSSVGRQAYLWGHSYFYTDCSSGRQAYLWDCVNCHFTLVLQLADKRTCETASFYTGSSTGRQAYLWDCVILHWFFKWQTSIPVRLSFYTGSSIVSKHTC